MRVAREEHNAIKRRATVLGVRPSTWARAVEQVYHVGVNLNQVVRAGSAVDEDILGDVLAAVSNARALLRDELAL